jgi:DUF971 family protein
MQPPTRITYHRGSKHLEIEFEGQACSLPAELLRVYSPSAEVRGHGEDTRKLQTGKKHVTITGIDPVGNYAVRLSFDDGHDTGIYSWEYLADLGRNQQSYWEAYLAELKSVNASRLPTIAVGHWSPSKD